MERESHNLCEDLDWFFEKDSDKDERANSLPYRDLKKSFLIAVCKSPEDDIAIALDFRTSLANQREIGNNWHSKTKGCPWEEISPTFEEFVNRIKIKNDRQQSIKRATRISRFSILLNYRLTNLHKVIEVDLT